MQPSGNLVNKGYRNTFKNGPEPKKTGVMPNVVHVGGLPASTVVKTGDARTDGRPHAPKPGP